MMIRTLFSIAVLSFCLFASHDGLAESPDKNVVEGTVVEWGLEAGVDSKGEILPYEQGYTLVSFEESKVYKIPNRKESYGISKGCEVTVRLVQAKPIALSTRVNFRGKLSMRDMYSAEFVKVENCPPVQGRIEFK